MKYIMLTIGFILPLYAGAFSQGFDVGNGGDIVYCENGIPFQARLLDFYEASLYEDTYKIDLGSQDLSLNAKIEYYANKIKDSSPLRSAFLKKGAQEFFSLVWWAENHSLIDVPDSQHLLVPSGCEVKQIAIQVEVGSIIEGKKYIIDKKLWDLLPVDDQVGLIFHEVLYGEAITLGHKNSVQVRKFNSLLAGSEVSALTRSEFSQQEQGHNFRVTNLNRHFPDLYLGRPFHDKDGDLKWAEILAPSHLVYGEQDIVLQKGTIVYFYKDDVSKIEFVSFDRLSSFDPGATLRYSDEAMINWNGKQFPLNYMDSCAAHNLPTEHNFSCRFFDIGFDKNGRENAKGTRKHYGTHYVYLHLWKSNQTLNLVINNQNLSALVSRFEFGDSEYGGAYFHDGYPTRFYLSHVQDLHVGRSLIKAMGEVSMNKSKISSIVATTGSVLDIEGVLTTVPDGECWQLFFQREGDAIRHVYNNTSCSTYYPADVIITPN